MKVNNKIEQFNIFIAISIVLHLLLIIFLSINQNKPVHFIKVSLNNLPMDVTVEKKFQNTKPLVAKAIDHKVIEEAINNQRSDDKKLKHAIAEQPKTQQLKKDSSYLKAKQEKDLKAIQEKKIQTEKELAQKKQQQKKQKEIAAEKLAAEKLATAKIAAAKAEQERQELARIQAEEIMLADELSRYASMIRDAIELNRIKLLTYSDDLSCQVNLRLNQDGSIAQLQIIKSSGNLEYDQLQLKAINKSAPFLVPDDQKIMSKLQDLNLNLTNNDQEDNQNGDG